VDGQIRMGLSEFVDELGMLRRVDGIPQGMRPVGYRVDVGLCRLSLSLGQVKALDMGHGYAPCRFGA
jgi:hypothetical protein